MAFGRFNLHHRNLNFRRVQFEELEARLQLSISLETVSQAGVPSATAAGHSYAIANSLSADGRYLAFVSDAPNLVSGAIIAPVANVYRFDRLTQETVLVSVSVDGQGGANDRIGSVQISDDGNTVAFTSRATNLHPLDFDSDMDVFARNVATGITTLVSVNSEGDASANSPCEAISMSADGTVIAFTSAATNVSDLDTNSFVDVFARDLVSETTVLVSVDYLGMAAGNSDSDYVSISANGLVVAFAGGASNLSPADTDFEWDVFAHDLQTRTTELVSVRNAGPRFSGTGSANPKINADGTVVAFDSRDDHLHPLDSDRSRHVFARDLSANVTHLVSVSALGDGAADDTANLRGI